MPPADKPSAHEAKPLPLSSPPPGAFWNQPGLWQALAVDLPVVVLFTDRHHLIRWLNHEAEVQLGYGVEELRNTPLEHLFPAEQGHLLQTTLQPLPKPQGRQTLPLWVRVQCKDGSCRLGRLTSRPVFAPDDTLLGWVHVLHPLSEPSLPQAPELAEMFIQGWVRVLHVRDLETTGHTYRVAQLTLMLGRTMGLSEAELVSWRQGAMLHDIGKIAIPDNILKKPGPLTTAEWQLMHQHPLLAREFINAAPFLPQEAIVIPLYHHERWDGSGYPFKLQGTQIPLAARVFAVVDVWDALCSTRPYRLPWAPEAVLRYLQHNRSILFDPVVVDLFTQLYRSGHIQPPSG